MATIILLCAIGLIALVLLGWRDYQHWCRIVRLEHTVRAHEHEIAALRAARVPDAEPSGERLTDGDGLTRVWTPGRRRAL